MSQLKVLFFDIGGVCLTDGWDEKTRRNAAEHFSLNFGKMEKRHKPLFKGLERGEILLNDYLAEVVFRENRSFSRAEFIRFMEGESKPHETTLKILKQLKRKSGCLLAALNNESLELNRYRIEKFGLRDYFTFFFSSCFLGARKPEAKIFEIALQVTQRKPSECLFIDDREENIRAAKASGFNAIHLKRVENLSSELVLWGIAGCPEAAVQSQGSQKECKI